MMFGANIFIQAIMCAAGASAAAALPPFTRAPTNLFVTSYAGTLSTLSISRNNGSYGMTKIASNTGCGPNPSWLTIDSKAKVLYCLDEGLTVPNGSLSSYAINKNGTLQQVQKAPCTSGPVSGAIYGDRKALALAHYSGSAVSSWNLLPDKPGSFSPNQNIPFKLSKPGTNPDRQDAPHEHEAIVDPTGAYVLVPDLGADLVRVFAHDAAGNLIPKEPLSVVPGSGPRHGAFLSVHSADMIAYKKQVYLYLVTELGNTVTAYAVKYLPNGGGLQFKEVQTMGTFGANKTVPAGNAAAEVAVSPDARFLVISNRYDASYKLPNPDPANSTQIVSDSFTTFAINFNDGSLSFVQQAPVGGTNPRQFAMNAAGDLVAVGVMYQDSAVLLKRDPKSGLIGDIVARVPIEGQVTCVRWGEATLDGTHSNT